MLRNLAISTLMFVSLLSESHQVAASPPMQTVSASESERNEKALLRYIWPTLKAAGKSGRIYYPAICQENKNFSYVAFPRVEVNRPAENEIGLAAIRDVFRNDHNVIVTEDDRGIVRIWIGKVPDAILHTHISALTLGPMSQYNDTLAIGAIENSTEVQSKMRKLKLRTPLKVYDMLVVQPAEGRPHLPASITDITMDQALDMMATTFKGIVLYGACAKQHFFDITFAGGIYSDDRWLNTESAPR